MYESLDGACDVFDLAHALQCLSEHLKAAQQDSAGWTHWFRHLNARKGAEKRTAEKDNRTDGSFVSFGTGELFFWEQVDRVMLTSDQ